MITIKEQNIQMSIPISKLPIFHNYLYSFIKNLGIDNISFQFIADNFFVKGYCGCAQKGCATIHLESSVSLESLKIINYKYDEIIQRLHLDEHSIVREFEYLDKKNYSEPIYKDEIFSAVDVVR